MSLFQFEKYLCYLLFLTGFIGAAFFTINLDLFSLFPHRILLIILWGMFGLRLFLKGKVKFVSEIAKPYFNFFTVWLLYAIISIVWAESKVDAIRNVIFLFMGVSLIFFATYYLREKMDLMVLYWMWNILTGCLILLGFWEHLTGHHLPVSKLYGRNDIWLWHRPTGVFYNPNDYATFLAISFPFMFGMIRYIKNVLTKIIGATGSIASFYLIAITGSRANIIAICLEVLFFFLFLTTLKQKLKILFTTLIGLVILRSILPINILSLLVSMELKSFTSHSETRVGSVAIRRNLAANCFGFLYPTAGLGVGAGNVEYWMDNFAQHNTRGILNAHNWWLEILTNYGIIIFMWYILIYSRFLIGLWRCWKKSNHWSEFLISEILLLSVIGFIIASTSSSSVMAFEPNWMIFAFLVAFINQMQNTK